MADITKLAESEAESASVAAGRGTAAALLLFDGVCNLCNGAVVFVIDRDPAGHFRFAPLQSESARRILAAHGRAASDMSSLVLIEGGRCYTRSAAALRTARRLNGGWPLLYLFMLVPRPVRDAVYDWVARNRYRWFGRSASCRVPTSATRGRFLLDAPQ